MKSCIFLSIIALVLSPALSFAPSNASQRHNARNELRAAIVGDIAEITKKINSGKNKPAKNHEEDVDLATALIMKFAAEFDQDSTVDDDDENFGQIVGSEAKAEDIKSDEDPLEKIKSFGKKIKGKFQKSSN